MGGVQMGTMRHPGVGMSGGIAALLLALGLPANPSAELPSEGVIPKPPGESSYPTVSLTFDDTHESHRWAAELLSLAGMVGTFYVNSERIGDQGYLRAEDLWAMEALGHEIGGHTLDHRALGNLDGDGVCRELDNCPAVANADQADSDGDGIGDKCDLCPDDAENDADGDGICANDDNCAAVANFDQADADGDGIGDLCDEKTPLVPKDPPQPSLPEDGSGCSSTGSGSLSIALGGLVSLCALRRRVRPRSARSSPCCLHAEAGV